MKRLPASEVTARWHFPAPALAAAKAVDGAGCSVVHFCPTCLEPATSMPTSVRLDIETEQLLARLAREKRTSKSMVLREAVAVLARRTAQGNNANADLYAKVEDLIGCVSGGPPDLSTRTGARFRDLLSKRRRRS